MQAVAISEVEVVLRLLVATALCGAVGFERETRDQSAGFRTHILLGLGAALFTLVSAYGFPAFTQAAIESGGRGVQFDPTRITAQIVTGIGFLGAGAIIRQGINVRGLTTATSLWVTAAIGTAAGAGYFFGAAATTAIVILSLTVLRGLEGRAISRLRREYGILVIEFDDVGENVSEVVADLERRGIGARILNIDFEGGKARYEIRLRVPESADVQAALVDVAAPQNVRRVSVTGLSSVE